MRALAPLALMVAAAGPLPAQQLPRHLQEHGSTSVPRQEGAAARASAHHVIGSAVSAGLGGVAGFYVLGFVGFQLGGGSDICGDDACGFMGGLLGALLGEAIGIGLGAHVGSGGEGDVWAPIGASLGVLMAAGMVVGRVDLPQEAIIAVPILQVAAAVWAAVKK